VRPFFGGGATILRDSGKCKDFPQTNPALTDGKGEERREFTGWLGICVNRYDKMRR
jgi:hypothetical protein